MSPAGDNNSPDSRVEQMVKHFSHPGPGMSAPPDCLPFPAGPLLPRQTTHYPPIVQHGLSNLDRVRLAYSLWPDEKGGQHQDKAAYSGSTDRLHLLSARAWCRLHDTTLENLTDVVDAWQAWRNQEDSKSESTEEGDRRIEREAVIKDRLLSKKRQRAEREGNALPDEAYFEPEYTCHCHTPTTASAPRVKTDLQQLATASVACKADPWGMLQRFWFKQLHSHHAQGWDLAVGLKYITPYHRAALGVLHKLRRQPGHPLAAAARALTDERLLPPSESKRLKAWYQRLQSPLWKTADWPEERPLPPALCPGKLGNPHNHLAAMLEMRVQLGLTEVVIRSIDMLAREVASVMTDPWVTAQLDWQKSDVDAMQQRLYQETQGRKRVEFLDQVDDSACFPYILNRRRANQKYLHWSVPDWFQRDLRATKSLASSTQP